MFAGNEKGCTEGGVEFKGANTTVVCNGKKGANGTSVVSSPEPKGANCTEGGSKFVAGASTTFACNGKEGSPWTAGGTLPSGKTETGAWTVGEISAGAEPPSACCIEVPISFAIPLGAIITEAKTHYNLKGFPTGATAEEIENCPGSAEEPKAKAGHLCIYTGSQEGTVELNFIRRAGSESSGGASTAGSSLSLFVVAGGQAIGTWAVTAP